jgi:hypothetical protein
VAVSGITPKEEEDIMKNLIVYDDLEEKIEIVRGSIRNGIKDFDLIVHHGNPIWDDFYEKGANAWIEDDVIEDIHLTIEIMNYDNPDMIQVRAVPSIKDAFRRISYKRPTSTDIMEALLVLANRGHIDIHAVVGYEEVSNKVIFEKKKDGTSVGYYRNMEYYLDEQFRYTKPYWYPAHVLMGFAHAVVNRFCLI